MFLNSVKPWLAAMSDSVLHSVTLRVTGAVSYTHLDVYKRQALCEKIAALHGGRLQIESVEGEGTAVTVRLPAADGKEGGAAV